MNYITLVSGKVSSFNAAKFTYDYKPDEDHYIDFLSKSGRVNELYEAIHITDNYNTPKFIPSSDSVAKGY